MKDIFKQQTAINKKLMRFGQLTKLLQDKNIRKTILNRGQRKLIVALNKKWKKLFFAKLEISKGKKYFKHVNHSCQVSL